jgi:hypothetical protein
MFIPCCDQSIDFMYMTMTYNVIKVLILCNKRGCDFNELVYGPRSHWLVELEILLSLDSDDLPSHHVLLRTDTL